MADKKIRFVVQEHGTEKAARGLDRVDKNMASLAKSALAVGAAYFSVTGVVNAFKTSIRLAAQQEKVERALTDAIGSQSKALIEQAAALQSMTTFADEAIIQQQAFLASLNFTREEIEKIIPLALDLATATGQTLEFAVRNIAKTYAGLTGELGELIPQLKELTAEELRAGKALETIAELMGGRAALAADTMEGSIDQMKYALGDAAEAIGAVMAPAVIGLAGEFKKLGEEISRAMKVLRGETGGGGDDRDIGEILENARLSVEWMNRSLETFASRNSDVNLILQKQVELFDDVALSTADITTDFQKFAVDVVPVMQSFANSIAQAAIYGQDMGEAVVSSLKAIAAQLVAQAAIYGLLALIPGVGTSLSFGSFVLNGLTDGNQGIGAVPMTGGAGNSGGGGEVILNFNAPVTNRDFIRDVVVPEIENARRLNA